MELLPLYEIDYGLYYMADKCLSYGSLIFFFIQVSAKEKELQVALQKQERYQQAVQEMTAKMERAQISLARTPASVAADVDTQMKDYKVNYHLVFE